MKWLPSAWGPLASGLARRIRPWQRAAGRLLPDDTESGQGLAEYALILALIAIVAISALALFGTNLRDVFLDPIAADISGVLSGMTP